MSNLVIRIKIILAKLNWRWIGISSVFVLIALSLHFWNHPRNLDIYITATLPPGVKTTLYYTKGHRLFKDSQSIQHINKNFQESTHTYTVRTWSTISQLRWDPMEHEGRISLKRINVSNKINHWSLEAPQIGQATHNPHLIEWVGHDSTGERIVSTGEDPHMEWHLPESLNNIPKDVWVKHALTTLSATAFLTWGLLMTILWLSGKTQKNGRRWLGRILGTTMSLALLALSAGQLSMQHDWWTWDLVKHSNERDGIRDALPTLIQDAKALLQRIDPQTPVALSPSWRENYFHYYAAEEYLYPRRLVDQAHLQLSEKEAEIDPKCQPFLEHGDAVLLECHE